MGTSDVWADLDGGRRGQPFRSHSLFLGKRDFWASAGIFFQIQMLLYYCVFFFLFEKGGKLKAKFFLLD